MAILHLKKAIERSIKSVKLIKVYVYICVCFSYTSLRLCISTLVASKLLIVALLFCISNCIGL